MAFRTFADRDGHQWEIRDRSKREWELEPVGSNPHPRRIVPPPSYEADPFELSKEELQRLLDSALAERPRQSKSPFRD